MPGVSANSTVSEKEDCVHNVFRLNSDRPVPAPPPAGSREVTRDDSLFAIIGIVVVSTILILSLYFIKKYLL
jgi:hypothetical protein